MDITSGKKISLTGRIVKCGRYDMTMFIRLEDCERCKEHRGAVLIVQSVNGRPEEWDILCGIPVHRRVEYIATGESNDASTE